MRSIKQPYDYPSATVHKFLSGSVIIQMSSYGKVHFLISVHKKKGKTI